MGSCRVDGLGTIGWLAAFELGVWDQGIAWLDFIDCFHGNEMRPEMMCVVNIYYYAIFYERPSSTTVDSGGFLSEVQDVTTIG